MTPCPWSAARGRGPPRLTRIARTGSEDRQGQRTTDNGPPTTDRLDAARQRLAIRHLAGAIARGVAWARYGGADPPDLVGAAQLGLVHAAATYRRGSAPWRCWARTCVDAACRRELRAWGRYRSRCRVVEDLPEMPAPAPPESCPELADAWRALPDRDRQVLMMRFGLGRTYAEIGEAIGMTAAGTHRAERKAVERLRAALGDSA